MSIVLLSLLLVLFTIFVHTLTSVFIYSFLNPKRNINTGFQRIIHIDLIITIILLATIIEGMGWAIVYVRIGSIISFEEALYFSLVTFTTLGYGDIVLKGGYRLLGAIEAANGVIMMGWSTALVLFSIQKVYSRKKGDQDLS